MRSRTLLLSLFVAFNAIACSASSDSDAAGENDSDWVVRPNGTSDRATVTLKLPEGFAQDQGDIHFDFSLGGRKVTPGVALVTDTSTIAIEVSLTRANDPGDPLSSQVLGSVTPTAGADTEVTFGTVLAHLENLVEVPGHKNLYLDTDKTAASASLIIGAASTWGIYVDASGRQLYPTNTTADLPLPGLDLPLPAGKSKLRLDHTYVTAEGFGSAGTDQRDIVITPGKRTEVAFAAAPIAALATVSIAQLDPSTMPGLKDGESIIWCESHRYDQDGDEATLALKVGDSGTIYATPGERWCTVTLDGLGIDGVRRMDFPPTPGSNFHVDLHRIEVDDVTITDASPLKKQSGEFSVTQDGAPVVLNGKTRFPTAHGIAVPAGHKYGVTVFYKNAVGVEKTTSFEQDL